MEFIIQKDTLLAGIRKTLGIVEKKTTMPILNNILIRARENLVTIIATDIEITLVANYPAEIMSEGEVTVSAKKVYEMIRETPEGNVHVSKNEKNLLTITCQKSVYKINGLPAEDFPSIAEGEELVLYKVDRKVLGNLIAKTIFATSTDDTRINLTGALLEASVDGKKIARMVATDGHRMAVAVAEIEGSDFLHLEKGVIIPRKGLAEIRKLIEETQEDAFLGVQQGKCVVKSAEVVLKVNLIDADFPDYRRVIPQERGTLLKFDKDMILHALRRINVISSDGYGGVMMKLKEGQVDLMSNDPDVGEASDEISVAYTGEEVSVAYNVAYLINAIEVIDEQNVIFEMGGGTKPSMVRGDGSDAYFCIVMPLKI